MELSERLVDGDALPEGIKAAVKNKLASFVGVVRKLRRSAQKGTSVADLLKLVLEKTGYEDYLRTTQQDPESRLENVKELVSPLSAELMVDLFQRDCCGRAISSSHG
jgi:DNA helicase-2/ATP-dependent DNA helicase PcrA